MMGAHKQTFVFGIDGGGTASTCLVCDLSGHALARIPGGALNFHPQHVGLERAMENLKELLTKAFTSVNCNPDQIENICLAISGVDRKEDAELVRSQFEKLFHCPAEMRICNDREAAWAGATGLAPGVVTICGTGGAVFGFNGKLRTGLDTFRIVGTTGSILGCSTLKRALLKDTPDASRLRKALLIHLNIAGGRMELANWFQRGPAARELASLCLPLVVEAKCGNPLALNLLKEAGEDLGYATLILIRRLFDYTEPCHVYPVGGVFKGAGDLVISPFTKIINTFQKESHILPPELPPEAGACLLALEKNKKVPTDMRIKHLKVGVEKLRTETKTLTQEGKYIL